MPDREVPMASPLEWPAGVPRTPAEERERAKFGSRDGARWGLSPLSVPQGRNRLVEELDRLGADNVVITSDYRVKQDGYPYANATEPDDSGVSAYFDLEGERKSIAVDRYTRVADNLAAIAATVEAMRAIERHGGATILRSAMSGFRALPAAGSGDPWWTVLGADSPDELTTLESINAAFRRRAREAHPDRGGSIEEFSRLKHAREQALDAQGVR